eukprot:TRINITY_DN46996_c0_g1_i1.p1 TRINITY_DN46996_c0_g1~~TRINITY_DN46996_c0_g1_i1.p1  ORF type:complete len:600 (+),score=99.21 TRINITY_DN46996_c0_g1_i1:79-1878(+)
MATPLAGAPRKDMHLEALFHYPPRRVSSQPVLTARANAAEESRESPAPFKPLRRMGYDHASAGTSWKVSESWKVDEPSTPQPRSGRRHSSAVGQGRQPGEWLAMGGDPSAEVCDLFSRVVKRSPSTDSRQSEGERQDVAAGRRGAAGQLANSDRMKMLLQGDANISTPQCSKFATDAAGRAATANPWGRQPKKGCIGGPPLGHAAYGKTGAYARRDQAGAPMQISGSNGGSYACSMSRASGSVAGDSDYESDRESIVSGCSGTGRTPRRQQQPQLLSAATTPRLQATPRQQTPRRSAGTPAVLSARRFDGDLAGRDAERAESPASSCASSMYDYAGSYAGRGRAGSQAGSRAGSPRRALESLRLDLSSRASANDDGASCASAMQAGLASARRARPGDYDDFASSASQSRATTPRATPRGAPLGSSAPSDRCRPAGRASSIAGSDVQSFAIAATPRSEASSATPRRSIQRSGSSTPASLVSSVPSSATSLSYSGLLRPRGGLGADAATPGSRKVPSRSVGARSLGSSCSSRSRSSATSSTTSALSSRPGANSATNFGCRSFGGGGFSASRRGSSEASFARGGAAGGKHQQHGGRTPKWAP